MRQRKPAGHIRFAQALEHRHGNGRRLHADRKIIQRADLPEIIHQLFQQHGGFFNFFFLFQLGRHITAHAPLTQSLQKLILPAAAQPEEPGGMLDTCGLGNIGGADESDPACVHPIHGRIGYQSADCFGYDCAWQGEDYMLTLEGRMRETRLYGRSLELRRRIRTSLNASEIEITDTITNCSDAPEPVFLLYHFNFGYPLLCEDSVFFCPPSEQTELSDVGDRNSRSMSAPVDGAAQQTFRHRPLSGGEIVSGLYNPKLELAAYLRFDSAELPYFLEWKCMKSHDYVLAIEPVNCPANGRASDLASGDVPVLGAYESSSYRVVLGVSEGEAAKKLISESKS